MTSEFVKNWNEIRTAAQVAKLGTVSAAAAALGVHRATVIRHVETLEEALGGKLFQRHARGYTPTEAGDDLLRVAQATNDQFEELATRAKGREAELSGELIVTSLEVIAPMVLPALNEFRQRHPAARVKYLASERVFKLEYGEAHIAIRAGRKPEHPDNVVQPFLMFRLGLYAHKDYVARHGRPNSPDEFANHSFVGSDNPNSQTSIQKWLRKHVPEENFVLRSPILRILDQAVLAGIGIGSFPEVWASGHNDLIEIEAPRRTWDVPFWLVTHVDLHRTPKIQAFLEILKTSRRIPTNKLKIYDLPKPQVRETATRGE